jgi:N12 class adenine-specific DNA methylase
MAEVPATETANIGPIRRARASLAALETLQRLRQAPHTPPSPDDLATLRGWSGWGPLAPALEGSRTGSWKEIGERIAFLLPEQDYNHGIQATYNAFYTPPQITAASWQILTALGFTGGRILEPGCGAGAFMAATPEEIPASWIGVERDPTTAAIASLLHPGATIHNRRLEETALPSYSVDAVLGNVPFGDTKLYDPTTPRELTANLHNYFIYRSVKALRPGGIAVLVTSRYTMDAAGDTAQAARTLISREAELLGAIRLPNDALTSGGTEPLVDVLVLRRRRGDEEVRPDQHRWITTGPSVGAQQVNSYFLANPRMVLGVLAEDSAPRWGRTLRVDARPDDPPVEVAMAAAGSEMVRQALDAQRGWRVDLGASPITAESAPFKLRTDGKKEGSFHRVDGVVHEVVEGALTKVERPGRELPKLVALRDAILTLLDAEADHSRPDEELAPLRAEAARLYDAYVKAHGYLNRYTVVEGKPDEDGVAISSRRRPAMGGFRRDPDFVTVLALEDFDDDTRTATKAALLTRRVNRPRERATHAESAAEAIALCRDELGRFDLDRVVELLGVDKPEAERRLADVAFIDPATDTWVPADEYLTGNVRIKLARAKSAAALDAERFGGNVPALEAVIPADLEPEQIEANLGAPWIPAADVQAFAVELLGFPVSVWHEPRTNTWSVTASLRAQESAPATTDWGTYRLNAYQLLEYGLNGKAPVVYDFIDDKRVRNQDETLSANDRLDAIAARFADWWREEPDRADRLTHHYNQTFNAIVPRTYDGTHLTFPGMDSQFEPYPHQRDMVSRMISGDDALCPYPVGTGKTATMFMAALKLKALGLASKPLIIVVPSTLEQIARDGKRLFPNARILMAGKEDLGSPRARKLFAARCAMEDWDAVVMSHPSFTSLPVHPTVEADYLATLAADYRSALIEAKADGAEPRKIKQIAKMVDNLDARAKDLLDHATDDGVFFEHLGTDYLLVDEMHYFKNLAVPVHTDGFAINGSKRAQDLDMKLSWQRTRHPGQAVVTGFTGTPVSNTLLELFILQHYLQPRRMEELGLTSADAWAALFVRFATGVEITPDGGFRLNRRPVEIINIPELMHTVAEFAELRAPEAFPVVRPDVRRHLVVIESSETVRDYVHELADRADDIRAGGVLPSEDNMLKICSDGRKVALHESLVGLEPEGPGKIGAVAANVARTYHETKNLQLPGDDPTVRGRLQLVFCDLGTPNKDKGNQVYGLIRQQLIAAGVPAKQIRFIHEAATDAQRMVLFDQCDKGDVSVLLGSTDKLGVGVNVQRRAVALHHVDAPWRPDQVEQREGRVWRPKNLNPSVDLYRYVTKDSFDAFMWQTLERKEKALRPILSGQVTARNVEDIGDVALDYGQIKAVATGNPMLAELGELNVKVKSLASLGASHQRNQRRLRADIQTFTMQAAASQTTAEALEAIAKCAAGHNDGEPWLDAQLRALPADDVPGILGALAESTIAKGYCDGEVHWRGGLAVDFTYAKNRHDGELAARIIVGENRHRIDVPLNLAWTAKGQHWRIRDAIATTIANAAQTAAATRANIETLHQRIRENEAAIGQPFAEQGALDEVRARRIALNAAIREQAQKDEEARRNRAARAAAGTATGAEDDRDALLRRLHAAMSAMIQPVSAHDAAASTPIVNEELGALAESVTALPDTIDGDVLREEITETQAPPFAVTSGSGQPTNSAYSADSAQQDASTSADTPLPTSEPQAALATVEDEDSEAIEPGEDEIPEAEVVFGDPPISPLETGRGAAQAHDDPQLASNSLTIPPALVEPVPSPIQHAATASVPQTESTEPKPPATAHRTSWVRQHWHPPMSEPVDKSPYNTHSVYAAFCKDCDYLGPWHGREEGALEDKFDHAFPGWRELLPVVAAMEYQETQNKNAYAQWKNTIVELYPAGWVEADGPVLVARNRGGTRWHDDWFLGGNWNVCGVERAINLHAPARHKRRTRVVAASYQPNEPRPPISPAGPVGELTDLDTAAALGGIFTPAKLVGLGIALPDKAALRTWLKVRSQDSRDEHVGYRPAAPGQPPTFDTVTETREGLAVVVLTATERREGLIPWRQAAEYLRPALTPEACAHLSEFYEAFQRFYTNPQREIEPTLSALHALRGQAAAIHQAAAAANETKAVVAQPPTTQAVVEAENVLAAPPATTARLPEDAEPAPPLPTVLPVESPVLEPDAATQEPDYEQLYPEQFAQESRSSGQTQLQPETPAAGQAPTAPTQPAPVPPPTATRRFAQPPRAKERSQMFEQAVDLALQGFAVFPLVPGTKRPMFKNWEKRASTDPRQIARWWTTTPNANIAIACGPSNLLVIDLDKAKKPDGPRHGEQTLAKLAAGRELPRTFTVASARGGRHLYYRQPDGAALSITTGSDTAGLGPLVDTRGHGGFVVAPGSVFDGGTYRIEHDAAVAPLPAWITDELTKRPPAAPPPPAPAPSRTPVTDRRRAAYGNAALKQSADTVARAPEGTRNDTLNRESFRLGRLVGGDILDRNDAVAELRRAAHRAGLPPGEAAHTIASGLAAGIGHPRFIPDPAPHSQTSHPTKEAAMTTVTDQEPRTPSRPTTTPATEPANAATHTAQPDADQAPATTANEREVTKAPQSADATSVEKESSSAADSTSSTPHEAVTPHGPATASQSEFDFDDIWNGVRASIERARQAIPDWSELSTPDDLKPAIDEALRYLAQAPIPRTAGDAADSTTSQSAATAAPQPAPRVGQTTDAADLDEQLAAVDSAYAHARASGIPADRPEWAGISAIHSAVHNLWDTLKAAAGTYWAELSADVRVRGLLTTFATRAVRAIANLASAAATHLEQRGTQQQPGVETQGPGLRETYINARNQVRAHAATHEWQRITALWGTVNTLTRQAGDPGIRAVIARSADAISDYADTLARKTSQYDHTDTADALTALAAAAERHAASLRAEENHPTAHLQLRPAPAAANAAERPGSSPAPQQRTEAQLLQARARQVAQHAQARLGQTPRTAAAAPRHARGTANTQKQNHPMRPTQPAPPREPANIRPR